LSACCCRPRLPALLTLHGRPVPRERELPGWVGYAHSVPVRTGNGAADQHQLDGYGWVVDAAWVLVQAGHHLYSETWRAVRGFADLVARRWQEPDAGIWEIRGDAVHHAVAASTMAARRAACSRNGGPAALCPPDYPPVEGRVEETLWPTMRAVEA
jgi:GH15 family glucan-1,4-alpha-glucosidase